MFLGDAPSHVTATASTASPRAKLRLRMRLTLQEPKKLLMKSYDFGATFFGVTGGQPFLRKDLLEVIAYARWLGLSASIITDGRQMDQKTFEDIVKNKVRISVSIDGAEKNNDVIRGRGLTQRRFLRLKSFQKLGCLTALFTLLPTQKAEKPTWTRRICGMCWI